MPIQTYPKSAAEVVATLVELFEHQGKHELAGILRASQSRLEQTDSNDWNGGTDYFTLFLELPVALFAPIEPKLEDVEKAIQAKFPRVFRDTGPLVLSSVTITAAPSEPRSIARRVAANEANVASAWELGRLRLFISHVSAHKVAVGKLKRELRFVGISAFVAHEDIEPSLDWLDEIVKALVSMDALAALLTPDFHPSKWTDHEIGFALGLGILVIPVQLGSLPYGFIAKQQALIGDLNDPAALASKVVNVLGRHLQTAERMREALVVALEDAGSYEASRAVSHCIIAARGFTSAQLDRIENACENNDQVKDSSYVVPRIVRFLEQVRPKRKAPPEPEPPEPEDDDVPF